VVEHYEVVGGLGGAGEVAHSLEVPHVEGDHHLGLGWELLGRAEAIEAREEPVVGCDLVRVRE
jgi:hypothetical protein